MSRIRTSRAADPDVTLGGRLAAAFGSLLFSVPVMALVWLLFNSQLAFVTDWIIPMPWLGGAIVAFAVVAFIHPRLAADLFGRLCDLLVGLARWW